MTDDEIDLLTNRIQALFKIEVKVEIKYGVLNSTKWWLWVDDPSYLVDGELLVVSAPELDQLLSRVTQKIAASPKLRKMTVDRMS